MTMSAPITSTPLARTSGNQTARDPVVCCLSCMKVTGLRHNRLPHQIATLVNGSYPPAPCRRIDPEDVLSGISADGSATTVGAGFDLRAK